MKGLLIKEFYMILTYGRLVIIAILTFSLLNIFLSKTQFLIYPAILTSTIAIILLTYDEHYKWNIYCNTLPITRAQQVHSKYLVTLFTYLIIIITSSISLYLRHLYMPNNYTMNDFLSTMVMINVLSIVTSALQLPLLYKFGVNKGKIAYYVLFAIIMSITNMLSTNKLGYALFLDAPYLLFLASFVIFMLSWYISIVIYRKKEL